MDRDELWFLTEMDSQDDILARERDEDREYDEWDAYSIRIDLMDECDRLFGHIYQRKCAGPWNVTSATPANVKIKHGQPQTRRRELHSCHRTAWQRSLRADRAYAIAERQRLVGYVLDQDVREQLGDYLADRVTDVPSVGVTSYISYFGRNVGEYPLAEYERGDFADDYEEDEEFEPAWMQYGFNSEAEYEDYLDAYSELYEDDWHDPSYYDRHLGELETE